MNNQTDQLIGAFTMSVIHFNKQLNQVNNRMPTESTTGLIVINQYIEQAPEALCNLGKGMNTIARRQQDNRDGRS